MGFIGSTCTALPSFEAVCDWGPSRVVSAPSAMEMSNEAMESHAEPVGSESMEDRWDPNPADPPAFSESPAASDPPAAAGAAAAPRCDLLISGSGGGMGTCGWWNLLKMPSAPRKARVLQMELFGTMSGVIDGAIMKGSTWRWWCMCTCMLTA